MKLITDEVGSYLLRFRGETIGDCIALELIDCSGVSHD